MTIYEKKSNIKMCKIFRQPVPVCRNVRTLVMLADSWVLFKMWVDKKPEGTFLIRQQVRPNLILLTIDQSPNCLPRVC